MPRKQPPSKTLTVFQVRWRDPKWENYKTKSFLSAEAAGKEFDRRASTGLRVELRQTLRPVKLVETKMVPFDPVRRLAHLDAEAVRRSEFASARWAKRKARRMALDPSSDAAHHTLPPPSPEVKEGDRSG